MLQLMFDAPQPPYIRERGLSSSIGGMAGTSLHARLLYKRQVISFSTFAKN